jgi:phosphatidylglycerophosphate synthase
MTDDDRNAAPQRRPLKSRGVRVFQALSRTLARRGVSPNAISIASMGFAVLGGAALLATNESSGATERSLWFAAAACIQLRLLANMLDGMVAQDAGTGSKLGELYNEAPDRVSDAIFLIAAGFVAGSSPHLGYAAAVLALLVAYLRAIGAAAGAGQVFVGWMSKPQRMFTLTVLCLFEAGAPVEWRALRPLFDLGPAGLVLLLITVGSAWTCVVRWFEIKRRLGASA